MFLWLESKYKVLLSYWRAKRLSRFWAYCTQIYKKHISGPFLYKDITNLFAFETKVIFQGFYKQKHYFKLTVLCLSLFCAEQQLSIYFMCWLLTLQTSWMQEVHGIEMKVYWNSQLLLGRVSDLPPGIGICLPMEICNISQTKVAGQRSKALCFSACSCCFRSFPKAPFNP